MNNSLGVTQKEVVVTYFEVLSKNLSGETEENQEKSEDNRYLDRDSNRGPPE